MRGPGGHSSNTQAGVSLLGPEPLQRGPCEWPQVSVSWSGPTTRKCQCWVHSSGLGKWGRRASLGLLQSRHGDLLPRAAVHPETCPGQRQQGGPKPSTSCPALVRGAGVPEKSRGSRWTPTGSCPAVGPWHCAHPPPQHLLWTPCARSVHRALMASDPGLACSPREGPRSFRMSSCAHCP